ncbi:hypothetical protein [Mesorhizobium sp. Pch-S]|uniref:hypothetical protein n=1 Tax=Mesorhizobium sp. Pch-S TaxID=2082387 RepID=UPI001010740A|nr:hypothetical protein [Mesorhizobium sp. Pch-S]QAZ46750.1 hypothetical protein C1M53_31345 [Mesorhizobium sp. Pch-S]
MTALLLQFWPQIAATIAAIFVGWKLRQSGYTAAVNAQKAKEADAYAKHLQDITDASNARPTGRVSDDPYNRDNR